MSKDLNDMSIEDLIAHLATLNANNIYGPPEIEKVGKFLSAKLMLRNTERLQGLGVGLGQLNQTLHKGIDSTDKAAAESREHSRTMAGLTWALVVATVVVALAGVGQAIVSHRSTAETGKLVEIAGKQLTQAQLDSALVNRPYVEVQPVGLVPTNQADPKDATSSFYQLAVEITNHSDLPAVGVSISDFSLESVSRGLITLKDIPVEAENLTVFPQRSPKVLMTFVMNPATVSRYLKGEEDCHIYMKVTYGSANEANSGENLWYEGRWTYKGGQFFVKDSKADFGVPDS